MRPSRRQVQGVRLQDHQGRDGPRRRSLLRVLAVGLRTFWTLTNSKAFFLALYHRSLALRARCAAGPTLRPAAPPQWRGTSAERLVEVATEAQRHRWPGAAPLAP